MVEVNKGRDFYQRLADNLLKLQTDITDFAEIMRIQIQDALALRQQQMQMHAGVNP